MSNDNDSPQCSSAPSFSRKANQEPDLQIKDKLRVLCLHGYRQNGDNLKSKLGSFRKYIGKYAELVFITAPHLAAPLDPANEEPVPDHQRSWWFNKDDQTFKGTNKNGPAYGFQESLRFVEKAWKTEGPFQGLLGFSQGACFVGLICGLSKRKLTSIKPDFAILSSGFKSGSLAHKSAYEANITIPALHIYGSSDEIIPNEMSEELLPYFKNAEILEHSGGHYLPATAKQKQIYINFFQDRLQDYLECLELQNPGNVAVIGEEGEDDDDNDNESSHDNVNGCDDKRSDESV